MSGIAAVYDSSRAPIEPYLLDELLDAIAHRGRTASGWSEPGIALGQQTLPTTPEAEHESLPLTVAGGRFQIALDGRIDNRTDLLDALRPHQGPRPCTDAELIALAYERWGESAVGKLLGDFAFVLWDSRRRLLLAARDQRGFRPLVYARHGRRFVFGSEPQQLFTYPDISRTVDSLFLACHLTGATPPGGSTPYAAVSQLPAAHYLVIEQGEPRIERYWRFRPGTPLRVRSRQEAVEYFEEAFDKAVAAATRTTVRPGLLLSGGLDSSYVALGARKVAQVVAVHGYVPGSRGMDERGYARTVARELSLPLHEVDGSDCHSLASDYLPDASFDQPNQPMQAALQVRLAREAQALGCDVLLDGIGGDEALSGGPYYLCSLLVGGHPAALLSEARAWSQRSGVPLTKLLSAGLIKPMMPLGLRTRVRRLRGRPAPALTPPWIDDYALRALRLGGALPAARQAWPWDRQAEYDAVWAVHEREALPVIAWRDRNAYLPAGIEARSPFWDLRVVEAVARLPGWVHRDAGVPKALMRGAIADKLPPQIAGRKDKGVFDELLADGLLEREQERVHAALAGPLSRLLYVSPEALLAELESYRRLRHRWWHGLWRAVTAGLWLQREEALRAARRPQTRPLALAAAGQRYGLS